MGVDGVRVAVMEVGREVWGLLRPGGRGRVVFVMGVCVFVMPVFVRLRLRVAPLIDLGRLMPAVLVHW